MKLVDRLYLIWVVVQLVLYTVFGIGPLVVGIYMIYISQTEFLTYEYQESMYFGLGIVASVVGLLIAWACLIRGVELYRSYGQSVSK